MVPVTSEKRLSATAGEVARGEGPAPREITAHPPCSTTTLIEQDWTAGALVAANGEVVGAGGASTDQLPDVAQRVKGQPVPALTQLIAATKPYPAAASVMSQGALARTAAVAKSG